MSNEMSVFARTIMEQKYSHVKPDGALETWDDIAKRVAGNVMGAVKPRGFFGSLFAWCLKRRAKVRTSGK